jgi:hypothetical protein
MARKDLIVAIFAPLIVACSPFAAFSAPALAPGQVSLVQQTCDRVMGLAQGGLYRELCRESLSQSLARKTEGAAMAASYSDCRHQGLSEGSAAFSTCMLNRQFRSRASAPQAVSLAYDANAPESTKSYFDVDNMVHWRREQYSCAQLGLTPGTGSFGKCVTNLDGAMLPNPN